MPRMSFESLRPRLLPACGDKVAPDADALAYRGGFYHLVCALWHRECRGRTLARRELTTGSDGARHRAPQRGRTGRASPPI